MAIAQKFDADARPIPQIALPEEEPSPQEQARRSSDSREPPAKDSAAVD